MISLRARAWCWLAALLIGTAVLVAQRDTPAGLWATYLTGPEFEAARDVAVDGQGNFYVTGASASPGFPTTGNAHDRSHNGSADVVLLKFAPDGTLLYSTFLGGPNYDRAYAIEVDPAGNVYLGGRAGDQFPTTGGVVQPSFGGDVAPNALYGSQDGFVAKFSPGLELLWATYFGGDDLGTVRDIAVDASGVYLASVARRPLRHVPSNAYQPSIRGPQDALIAKLAPDGRSVQYASYFGGSAGETGENSVRVDDQGRAYLLSGTQSGDAPTTDGALQRTHGGGQDWLLAKFAADGRSLVFSTYVGGNGGDQVETHHLAVDGQGRATIAAPSTSTNLQTTAGAFQASYRGTGGGCSNYCGDGYIVTLSADGSAIVAATYLGGSGGDGIEGVGVDSSGDIAVTGGTFSGNFPVTSDAPFRTTSGAIEAFVARLSADLSTLRFSTYYGGPSNDVGRSLTAAGGVIYVAGETLSPNLPTSANALSRSYGGNGMSDGFVLRWGLPGSQSPGPSPTPPAPVKPPAPVALRIVP